MKKSVAAKMEETDSSTETESLLENTPRRMSDPETFTAPSVSITFEKVARQIKAVTDPVTQQLAQICELMQVIRNEQTHRRHEEIASSRTASTSTGSADRFDSGFSVFYAGHLPIQINSFSQILGSDVDIILKISLYAIL